MNVFMIDRMKCEESPGFLIDFGFLFPCYNHFSELGNSSQMGAFRLSPGNEIRENILRVFFSFAFNVSKSKLIEPKLLLKKS